MKRLRAYLVFIIEQPLMLGGGSAIVFWLLEAWMDDVFDEGTFLQRLFPADDNEIWMRLVIISLILVVSIYAHVTHKQRRRAHAALCTAEEKYRGIVENALEGIFQATPDGRITMANAMLARILGYASPAELMTAMANRRNFLDADHAGTSELGQLLQQYGTVSGFECQVRCKDESSRWISVHARAVADATGRLLYYEGMVADISERKRAAEAQLRLVAALEAAGEMVVITDRDGTIQYVNPAFERITGYRRAEAIGQTPRILKSGKHAASVYQELWQTLVSGQTWRGVLINRRKDGSYFDAEETIAPVRDCAGKITNYVNVARDITQRRRVEEELRQHARRLKILHAIDRAILGAQTPEAIAQGTVGHVRDLVPCQRASVTLFDFERMHAIMLAIQADGEPTTRAGTHMSLEAAAHLAALRKGKLQLIDDLQGCAQLSPSMQQRRAEGLRSYMSMPLMAQGELLGTLSLASAVPNAFDQQHQDIARQVADQLAITIQHARLFEQVRSGRERLAIVSRRLLEVQENERRHIARELHDEIGQALTAVKINLQAIQRTVQVGSVQPRLEESITITEEVLQQVRNLSLDLRPSLLDDLGLVSALRWYLDRVAQRAGLTAHVAADPRETGMPSELETTCFRVVQEAVTNVVRYAQAQRITVELRRDGATVVLTIADDGVGFDVQAARQRAAGGASLGLLGMHERVELVGGQFDIEAAPLQGTIVRARFPLPLLVDLPSGAERIERRIAG